VADQRRGISRCFSRDEKSYPAKDYPDLDISKCKSTLFKVVIALNTMSEKFARCRAILVNLGGKGKMCVQIMMVVRLPLILICFYRYCNLDSRVQGAVVAGLMPML
jgi:hypothetical protein